MAQRSKDKNDAEVLRPVIARHIRDLGLRDVPAYFEWCARNGVAVSLDKSAEARAAEVALVAAAMASADARSKLHRNPRRFIAEACAGRIDPAAVDRPGWREVAQAISRSKDGAGERESLAAFLLRFERVSNLLFETVTVLHTPMLYLEGLIRLHERRGQWLRDPLAWKVSSHNAGRQFSALARHLLARYDVPLFLDSAWLRGDRGASRFRDWFVHIGLGHNMRTAKTPYPMTKMIAHHFVSAPADFSIEGALMLADIKAMNGGERLAAALMGTRLGQRVERDPERRAFWLSVYRFFIANPMLDLAHAGPIVDFLNFQKYESQEVMVGPNRAETRPPPQPNLTMTRRTPDSLLRQVEDWHGALRAVRANADRFWKTSGIPGLTLQKGSRDDPDRLQLWTFRELLSGQDLIDNGRALKHCVASYAHSCARGACSIWSLEMRMGNERRGDPVLTVEVDANRVVVQARGRANRRPDEGEQAMLETWMKKGALKPGNYLYGW
ncbi:MAG: hypothetical protein HOP13_18880 [Alphaproteobacteria bacterium]|nr:hypothetical protein [Alphaproteobacteria bacterium]